MLDDILNRLNSLPVKDAREIVMAAEVATKHLLWQPNAGPQTQAYFSPADETFYGGQAGGGKTDLLLGLALNSHEKSLILRRTNREAEGLNIRLSEIIGNKSNYHSQKNTWELSEHTIDVGGCQLEDDKQKYKGTPHDLVGFDEVSDFSLQQYTFIIAWNRSVNPKQRCRVVAAGNPPTRPEGLWVLQRWGAWLSPLHPNPAQPGELRWYTTNDEGEEIESEVAIPHARSRTFIPAELSDNPDLARTEYGAVLDSLPKELRAAYRDGNFNAGLRDGAFQCIPTDWVMQAISRHTDKPPVNAPMCTIGLDIAQGGDDQTVAAPRYDGWFAPLIKVPGRDTPNGAKAAGFVMSLRRDSARIIIDMGGGYGGACYEWLKDNEVDVVSYKGAEGSTARTMDRQLTFRNKRSQAYWQFREALDPAQPGGSPIMLPDDRELIADLCAPTFVVGPQGIQVESKEDVVKRLRRSTDCFIAGTLVRTPRGQVAIEKLKVGDDVITPYGTRKIIKTHKVMCFDIKEFKYKGVTILRGKAGHKIFTWNRGAIDFTLAGDADIMERYSIFGLLKWRLLNLLYTMGRSSGFKAQVNIIPDGMFQGNQIFFTEEYGSITLEKSRLVSIFIILMETGRTMMWEIWNVFIKQYIYENITIKGSNKRVSWINILRGWKRRDLWHLLGTDLKKVWFGIASMASEHGIIESLFQKYANAAELNLFPEWNVNFALQSACNEQTQKNLKQNLDVVKYAPLSLKQININPQDAVQGFVQTDLLPKIGLVYDITLDEDNVYYANDVLVFNCGDSVVMSWSTGNKMATQRGGWSNNSRNKPLKVVMGYPATRAKLNKMQ